MASAIMAAAAAAGVDAGAADGVRALPGRGIEGTLSRGPVWLGSHRLLEERGQETPEMHRLADELAQEGLKSVPGITISPSSPRDRRPRQRWPIATAHHGRVARTS